MDEKLEVVSTETATENQQKIDSAQKPEENFSASEQEKIDAATTEEEKKAKQKMDEAEQTVSKQSSKKSKITNLIFFIVNLAVVAGILIYQLTNEEFVSLKGHDFSPLYFFIMMLVLAGVLFFDSFMISYLLKQSTGKWRPALAFKTAQIGRYYDSVTPMATGGQAFQVTYLKGRGVPIHNALSVPLAKYMFNQVGWLVISLVAIIMSSIENKYGTFVGIASIVGFVLSFFVLFLMFFLSISKKLGRVLVAKGLKLLYKMKIIKNYDKQYEKITKSISDYQDVMKQYASSPKDFIIMSVASIAKYFCNYSLPFFIVKFFVPSFGAEMFMQMLVMGTLVDLSSSFFPLPGGTGMNEISFTAAFASVVKGQAPLVWVLLLWRFCSYYFYLIQGIMILSYDIAYGNRRYRWQVVKNNLAEESSVFKQQQINRFRADRAKRRNAKIK